MSLANLVIQTKEVSCGAAGHFQVRGLSFRDLSTLLINAKDNVQDAFSLYNSQDKNEKGEVDSIKFLTALMAELPELTAKIIALASREPEQWPIVLELSAPLQLEALMAVAQMTFEEPDSLKNFIANLTTAAATGTQISNLLPKIPEPGSGITTT